MIDFKRVRFAYPESTSLALRDVDLQIDDGEFVVVGGLSGSGKSTFLRFLNGLVPHFSGGTFGGRVSVAGHDTRHYGPRALSMVTGFVFQDPEAQGVAGTVEEDIAFSMEQLGIDRSIMRKRVEEVLDLFGLAPLRRRSLTTLSGGERQRVALAGAIALHPQLLVLDEPTSQLDPWGADDLIHAISLLNADLGTTVVVAEHRLDRLLPQLSRFAWIDDGDVMLWPDLYCASRAVPEVCLPSIVRLAMRAGIRSRPTTVRDLRRALPDEIPGPRGEAPSASAGNMAVDVRGLTVRREGRVVLGAIDFSAREGEIVALMGRNGSGKTTLLRSLFGFIPVERGSISVAGLDMRTSPAHELGRRAAYLPQQSRTVLFNGSLREEIRFTMRMRGSITWPEDLIDLLDMQHLLDRDARDLSEGERLRAALLAVLTGSPQVVLLDEPTRGLDGKQKHHLIDLVRALSREGACVVIATHDVELIAMLADRVVLLGDGEIVAEGPTRDVLSGSLAYSTVVNRVFGPGFLTLDDVALELRPAGDTIVPVH